MCEQEVTTCTQVIDNILDFGDLLEQVLNGVFQMNLPASFKKVVIPTKPAAIDEFKQAATENKGEGNGGNKKKQTNKNSNGNLVKNSAQDKDFTMVAGELWKDTFSKRFPHKSQIWDGKIKMCTRWHIKGDCYDNCCELQAMSPKTRYQPRRN